MLASNAIANWKTFFREEFVRIQFSVFIKSNHRGTDSLPGFFLKTLN